MFSITGTIKVKGSEQQVSGKFKKREFVITENSSQYPQFISFQLTQERCALLDSFNEGAEIKVFFNLRGREWVSPQNETKYFNSLEAWKIEGASAAAPTPQSSASSSSSSAPMPESIPAPTEEDDLPF
jgi:single-stranded DNA-binding protein